MEKLVMNALQLGAMDEKYGVDRDKHCKFKRSQEWIQRGYNNINSSINSNSNNNTNKISTMWMAYGKSKVNRSSSWIPLLHLREARLSWRFCFHCLNSNNNNNICFYYSRQEWTNLHNLYSAKRNKLSNYLIKWLTN